MTRAINFDVEVKKGKAKKESQLAERDPYDIAPIQLKLAPFKKAAEDMAAQAKAVKVTDDATSKKAVMMGKQAQDLKKQLEALRVGLVEAPNNYVKQVNALVKQFTEGPLKDAVDHLKKEIGNFDYQKELKRREEEKAAQEEAKRFQAQLDAQAKALDVEAPEVLMPVMPKASTVTRTETGASSHMRLVWDFEVTDAAQVPREFCQPDSKLIRQAVAGGVRIIPGVRIFEKPQSIIR